MKLMNVERITKTEKRYTKKMGILHTKVTYIRKRLLIFPLKTLHKYRNTYYGEVKDCEQCLLSR
ncbi:hypothetical protein [Maribacter sp. 2307ULW6-5]|uniref:hypothetical protein n=1 Tax=Maribacter sp. 2307ULW6-5 TaxID=3386275 RepID=UPI0039BC5664